MPRIAEHEMVLIPGRINKVNLHAEKVQIILTDGQILHTSFENLPDHEWPEHEVEETEEIAADPSAEEEPDENAPPAPEAVLLSDLDTSLPDGLLQAPVEPKVPETPEPETPAVDKVDDPTPEQALAPEVNAEEAPADPVVPEAVLASEVEPSVDDPSEEA